MPSLIYFGRAGLPTASGGDGLSLYRGEFECEGDEATVDLIVRGQSSANDAKALRDQLLGYHLNTDEPVIPITDLADTSRTGFYRVQRVKQVPELTGREGSSSAGIAYRLTAELLRVPGWQAPRIEDVLSGTVRVNSHAIAATGTILTWSPGVGAYSLDTSFSGTTVTGAEGAVIVLYDTSPTADFAAGPSYAAAAADYYKGCARIETSADSGTTWRTVAGGQIQNRPTYVRVANSLVRVTTTTTANKTELSVEWHDGSAWETAKLFRLTNDSSYTDYPVGPVAVTVLSNRPEGVAIRLEIAGATGDVQRYLDVAVDRGSRVVKCYTTANGVPGADYGVELGTGEAATDITGGIRATNNDAGGNKVIIATPKTVADTDNVNGKLRVSGQDEFPFALGCSIGGTVGSGLNETSGLVLEYLAAVNRRQNVGVR